MQNFIIVPSLKENGFKPASNDACIQNLQHLQYFLVQQTLMSEPEEIATMTGQKIPRKCSIGKIYFLQELFLWIQKNTAKIARVRTHKNLVLHGL